MTLPPAASTLASASPMSSTSTVQSAFWVCGKSDVRITPPLIPSSPSPVSTSQYVCPSQVWLFQPNASSKNFTVCSGSSERNSKWTTRGTLHLLSDETG